MLEEEGLPLSLAGRALLRAPTSSCSSCLRLGGIACFALAGSDFRLGGVIRSAPAGSNARLGGDLRVTPAGFPLGIGPGGRRGLALTSVACVLLCSGQLGLQGPSSHRFAELFGLCLYVHSGRRLRRRERPVLRALFGARRAALLAEALQPGSRGRKR